MPVDGLEQPGGVIAAEFEGVAPFDQAEALRGQALELDRFDLGAVLFELALALRLLVGVELALDALDLAVEQIDEGPEQIVGIVLEPGAGEQGFERFGDRAEMALDGVGSGHRPRIGLVLSRPVAVQRQLVEQIRGRRGGVVFGVGIAVGEGEGAVVRRHGGRLSAGGNSAAPIAAFTAIPGRGRRRGAPEGPQRSGGWRRGSILLRDAKPARSSGPAAENAHPAPLRRGSGRPPFGPPGGSGRSPLGKAVARPSVSG